MPKADLALPPDFEALVIGRQLGTGGRGRAVREAAGLTLREAALFLGTDPHTLSRWEMGLSRPRMAQAARWAEFTRRLEAVLAV
jgi:transcriptional regulator with XRE-family HTH domain